jgi:hypothetical protein
LGVDLVRTREVDCKGQRRRIMARKLSLSCKMQKKSAATDVAAGPERAVRLDAVLMELDFIP